MRHQYENSLNRKQTKTNSVKTMTNILKRIPYQKAFNLSSHLNVKTVVRKTSFA